MKKLSLTIGAIILLALLVLSLLTTLTTARTGMFQAQANATQAAATTIQSTTALISQCLTGVMVFIALVGGMVMGYGFHAWRTEYLHPRETGRQWLPGPNARWGWLPDAQPAQVSSPIMPHDGIYTVPSPTRTPPTHLLTMADLDVHPEGEEDFIGSQWGF
jgi:hypothetical protein